MKKWKITERFGNFIWRNVKRTLPYFSNCNFNL